MFFKKYSICKLANYFAVLLYSTHNLQYMHEYVCSFSLNGNIKKPTTNAIPTIGFSTFSCWKCAFRKLSLGFKSHAQIDVTIILSSRVGRLCTFRNFRNWESGARHFKLQYKDDSKTFVVLAQKGQVLLKILKNLK